MKENNLRKKQKLVTKNLKREAKGITLIALAVTIIVLLILAGVAINLTIGNNGIFSRAQDAKQKSEKADWEDKIEMAIAGKMIENQNPTIDDIIDELIAEDIIDEPSQVNKENGDITTNEPSYVISDKLNDFISNVKITISKTPETEPSGGVLLKVERVEGIKEKINLDDIDIEKLDESQKKEAAKEMYLNLANTEGVQIASFEEILKEMGKTEEEFWQMVEQKFDTIDNLNKSLIDSLKEKGIESIRNYKILDPINKNSYSYLAIKNGTYTFKVKEIISGKEYTQTVEITNIDESMDYYIIDDELYGIYLLDKFNNKTKFEEAYIIFKGERINITDCIEVHEEKSVIRGWDLQGKLVDSGIVENRNDIWGTIQSFEIVKDGKSYFGEAEVDWVE